MGIAARIMLVVAAALLVVGGVLATGHVVEQGYDCGTAIAPPESTNGQSEATPMGNVENNIDCGSRIRDRRSLAGAFAVAAALVCAAAVLSAGNIGTSRPRNEREALRLHG
jgi:hypothetical protein